MANEKILAALQKLDVNNDNHWTQDGLPRVETVRMLASDQALTREQVTAAAPEFTRLHAYNALQATQQAPAATAAPIQETQPAAQDTPPPAQPVADPVPPAALAATVIDAIVAESQDQDLRFEDLSKQEQLEVIEGQLSEINGYINSAQKEKIRLQTKRDDLIIAIDKDTPKHSNQHDIQAYLESQKKILNRRAEQISNVKKTESELGVRLADLVPKRAPIDSAMGRRSGHGRNRPRF